MANSDALLDVNDLALQVEGKTILAPVSFALQAGEQVVITGPSGCGKSTLLKLIAWLQSPSHGRVLLQGKPQTDFSPPQWRQQVSWCTQTPALFGDSVRDNLLFPWQLRKKKPEKGEMECWLEKVNLPAAMLNKPIAELSGGEKQRVALLRNLQFLPQVLLLDEVTSALDAGNSQTVRNLLQTLAEQEQVAILAVSHNRDEISGAQRVIRMSPPGKESVP